MCFFKQMFHLPQEKVSPCMPGVGGHRSRHPFPLKAEMWLARWPDSRKMLLGSHALSQLAGGKDE